MQNDKYGGVSRIAKIGLLLMGAAALLCGCETESPGNKVVINPEHIEIRTRQQHEFVASGGYNYEWSIENRELGILTRTPDNHRVIYTAIAAPEEESQVQVLKVASFVKGASERSNQSAATGDDDSNYDATSYRVRAEAYIVHLAVPEKEPPAEIDDLIITPAEATLTVSEGRKAFRASGGEPPYDWKLTDTSLGDLTSSGDTAIYRAGPDPGELFIQVTDSAGRQADAAIIQSPAP